MKKYLPVACVPLCGVVLSACSVLQPPDSGLQDNIVVSSSEQPTFEAKDVDTHEVTENLAEPVKDEGLNVQFELQGLYTGSGGTVVTVKIHNLNEVPMPADALEEPTLERADGNGGWAKAQSTHKQAAKAEADWLRERRKRIAEAAEGKAEGQEPGWSAKNRKRRYQILKGLTT